MGDGLWRDGAFRLFWLARTVSVAGTAVTLVALPLLVLRLTGSALATSALAAVEVLPYFVFGLLAGAVADRTDRRRLMVGCDLAAAAALLSVPVAAAHGVLTVGQVFVVAAVVATAFVWFDGAAFGALPALVGRDRIVAANSAVWSSATVAEVLFPSVGGVLVAVVGAEYALGADSVSYLASAGLIALLPRSLRAAPAGERAQTRIGADIREGLAFLRGHELVRTLTLLGFGNSVTGGAVAGLLAVYATRGLGLAGDDPRLGLLFTATAVGGLAASLALPWLTRRVPVGWVSIGALSANPVALLGVAAAPGLTLALPLLAVWSGASALAIVNGIAARQLVIPDRLQGRVNTTARMVAWGGTPFGAALGGVVATATSVRIALAVMAGAVAVAAVLAWCSGLRRRSWSVLDPAGPGPVVTVP